MNLYVLVKRILFKVTAMSIFTLAQSSSVEDHIQTFWRDSSLYAPNCDVFDTATLNSVL